MWCWGCGQGVLQSAGVCVVVWLRRRGECGCRECDGVCGRVWIWVLGGVGMCVGDGGGPALVVVVAGVSLWACVWCRCGCVV
jgi:hypothetical protein